MQEILTSSKGVGYCSVSSVHRLVDQGRIFPIQLMLPKACPAVHHHTRALQYHLPLDLGLFALERKSSLSGLQ